MKGALAAFACWAGQHEWDYAGETIHLRGDLKVTIRTCKHCGARRGDTVRI